MTCWAGDGIISGESIWIAIFLIGLGDFKTVVMELNSRSFVHGGEWRVVEGSDHVLMILLSSPDKAKGSRNPHGSCTTHTRPPEALPYPSSKSAQI